MAIESGDGDSTAASATHTGVGRLVFVDVMKVSAITVVIAHHAGQAYGRGADWAVDDAAMSGWLDAFFRVNPAFGMGLMFLFAAYFVRRSYDRNGPGPF